MLLQKRKYKAFDLIRLAFKVAPGWAIVLFIQQLLSALMPAFLVFATTNFIDTALNIINQEVAGNALYPPLIALVLIAAYQWMMRDVRKYIDSRILISTRLSFRVEIIEKRARLHYRYIEDQETYDLIKRVTDPSDSQIINQYNDTLDLFGIIVQVISFMLIIIVNVWWVAIVILLISIPTFYLGAKAGKTQYEADREMSKIERKAQYLAELCTGRDQALERTLFGYSDKITDKYWERFEYARKHKQKIKLNNFIQMKMGGIIVTLITGFMMLALLQPVASGSITIGLFMSLTNATTGLILTLSVGLSWRLRQFVLNKEYLKDLTVFCQLDDHEEYLDCRSEELSVFESLEFRNVSFTYPNTENRILDNVNFKIKPRMHYAFVGVNGAGKTTVIKLLTGQYQNYEGEVLLNGIEIRQYSVSELKSVFSVVYQDFAKYQLSVKENMLIGIPGSPDERRLLGIMEDLEIDNFVTKLPKGLDTALGKVQEDGLDLSGGQWQRLALARAVINPAPIKILDEPTAALDPLSESRLYEQFGKIIDNQTSIFISHRLGSIKLADEIFVFDNGTITEQGSHPDLMELKGNYFDMYSNQSSWYQPKEEAY